MPRLSTHCDASPIHTRGPSSVAARKPRNAPGALSALLTVALLAVALLAGCAATQPDRIPERMLTPPKPCRRPPARMPMVSPIT